MRFVDTNVLLYAISTDLGEAKKAARAREIVAAGDLAISVQVLQEFFVQATRRNRPDPVSHEHAHLLVESFRRFPVVELTVNLVMAALSTCKHFGISYWDAAIIEAAREVGCEKVVSEDLSDGQDYGGVRVENPFAVS